jgi:hypothetical protein
MPNSNGSKKVEIPYKFRTMKLADLKAHPDQADVREISDDSLKALSKHIEKVGLVEEIIINKRTGHIISGHQRRRVLLAQGYTTARIKVVDVTREVEKLMFVNLNSQAVSGNFTAGAVEFVMSLEAKLGSDQYQDVGLQMLEVELVGACAKENDRRKQTPGRIASVKTYGDSYRANLDNKDKIIARRIVRDNIKSGNISRQPCEHCPSINPAGAHHSDYSKPLDIVWLCAQCHTTVHRIFEFVIHYCEDKEIALEPFGGSSKILQVCEMVHRYLRREEYTGLKSKRIRKA